jgi:hypothetical protein
MIHTAHNAGRMEEEMNNVAELMRSNWVQAAEVEDLPIESSTSDVLISVNSGKMPRAHDRQSTSGNIFGT